MKAVFLFFVGLLLGACAHPAQPAQSPSPSHVPMARELASKTVALVAYKPDMAAYCSGVWVSPDVILTAFHCVDDMSIGEALDYAVRDDVYKPGSNELKDVKVGRAASVLALDEGHDLALLKAKAYPNHLVAQLTDGPVLQGAYAQTMGHSFGLWWTYSTGDVSAVRQLEINGMDLIWLQTNAPISPGNSGGGLFDEEGNLMGIAHAAVSAPRAQLLNFYIHRDYLRDFLTAGRR